MKNVYLELLAYSTEQEKKINEIYSSVEDEKLAWKPSEKEWSILAVIEHLSLVYDKYLDNLEHVISAAPTLEMGQQQRKRRTLLGRLSIYSQKPKKQQRKFKMKTFDFFMPQQKVNGAETWASFKSRKNAFHTLIQQAQSKDLNKQKIPTALGKNVQFYVAECIEFLLAHEERHVVQMEGIRTVLSRQ